MIYSRQSLVLPIVTDLCASELPNTADALSLVRNFDEDLARDLSTGSGELLLGGTGPLRRKRLHVNDADLEQATLDGVPKLIAVVICFFGRHNVTRHAN